MLCSGESCWCSEWASDWKFAHRCGRKPQELARPSSVLGDSLPQHIKFLLFKLTFVIFAPDGFYFTVLLSSNFSFVAQ